MPPINIDVTFADERTPALPLMDDPDPRSVVHVREHHGTGTVDTHAISCYLERLLTESIIIDDSGARARSGTHTLNSVYQPIFSLAHQRTIGYEGLVRARDISGDNIQPPRIFDTAITGEDVVRLDRACRTLHVHNFAPLSATDTWLFLNINPRVVVEGKRYGPFFAELLQHYGMLPRQIVVEVLENSSGDVGQLAEAVSYYRDLGCLIAIDDFGSGHSNFDRILHLKPDMVKLDRCLIEQARNNDTARRMLPNLIALLHETGSLVVLEGIEDEADALLALEANADFAQGYYFARPAPAAQLPVDIKPLFSQLSARARAQSAIQSEHKRKDLEPYVATFARCASDYAGGMNLESAAATLGQLPRVVRCYVLDAEGIQVERNVGLHRGSRNCTRRFAPLCATNGADWSRRPYFRRALEQPGMLQITSPYLSITGAHLTITLSQSIHRAGTVHVVCCDLRLDTA